MTIGITVLMSVMVLTIIGSAYMADDSLKSAYAQTADPGTNPDPTATDNSTDLGAPVDNSTDSSMPNDSSSDLGATPTDPSADLGLSPDASLNDTMSDNATNQPTSAVPEFGTLASVILVFSVLSVLIISKTKLKF